LHPGVSAPQILQRIAQPLAQALHHFAQHGWGHFAARYAARDALCGHAITTTHPELAHGIARGICNQGGLRLETHPGAPWHTLSHGEVSVRRDTPAAPSPDHRTPPC
jgi:biotin-(acetyl-CoA carboxylase) ligase